MPLAANPGDLLTYVNQSATVNPIIKVNVSAIGVVFLNLNACNANGNTVDFLSRSFSQEVNISVSTSRLFGPLYLTQAFIQYKSL